ncbi:MAG: hypothetical protein DIZ80_00275 [endosymbiont of Galathealinum brachiosum]|uniref:Copper resistance protein D domain-containing protein n=1 Tax=endosymbiont of Galathealinum brachiosum TaxID=2200906 RepID=A0A370DNS0_9GAMM|nr:MAG: hypothetical protein DIZ80_00275 [endosymbiont of Galathealinum brachiosum]
MLNAIAIIIHLIAINIWVGGMFFLIVVSGPAISMLDQEQQLAVWVNILKSFFFWVWLAVLTLLSSGIGMLIYRFNDFMNAPVYILVMACLGVLMIVVFLLIYFIFYQKFKRSIQSHAHERAEGHLRVIRILGLINMLLGLCVVIAIAGGPYILY